MAFTSGVVIDSDFNFDGAGVENRTTGELIRMLKSSFGDADFAKVESILVQREDKLKQELETVVQANEWLKEKLDDTGMKKQIAEIEQKKLQALNSRLMERAGEAENVIEFWKKKYEGLESRIRKLDADVMLVASVEPSARVSSQIGNNVVEENVDLVGANVDRAAEGEGEDMPKTRGVDSHHPSTSYIERHRPTASERRRRAVDGGVDVSDQEQPENIAGVDVSYQEQPENIADTTPILQSFNTHIAYKILNGEERNVLKVFSHYPKLELWRFRSNQTRMKTYIENSGLAPLLQGGQPVINPRLISAFCERWHTETNTFHLPIGEMTITLDDISCLLHLPIGGTAVRLDRIQRRGGIDILQQLLGIDLQTAEAEVDHNKGPNVRLSFLRNRFMIVDDSYIEQAIQYATRAYLLHLVGCTIFADKSGASVPVIYLTLFADLTRINQYAWGAAALAYTYRQLGVASRFKVNTIAGYMTILQSWIYEHFCSFSSAISPTYDEALPRACRRMPCKVTESLQQLRNQIEDLTVEQVRWSPYASHRQTQRCLSVAYFRGYLRCGQILEGYMPDRVLRQFRYEQSFPMHPLPSHEQINNEDEVDEQWTNWRQHVLPAALRGTRCPNTIPDLCVASYLQWLQTVSVLSLRPNTAPARSTTSAAMSTAPAATRPSASTIRRPVRFVMPLSFDDAVARLQRAHQFILAATEEEQQSIYNWNQAAFSCARILSGTDVAGPTTVPAPTSPPSPVQAETSPDSRRPTSRNIIPISDSDSSDDCSSEESLSRNEMTCQKGANVDRSRQTGVQYVTGMFKRKHNSCPNVSENDNSNFGGVKDEDVEGNSLTADGKVAKIQKLSHGLEGSSINHCTKMAASSRTRREKFCTPSSQRTVISRQSEEKAGTEYSSLNLMRDILLGMPGDCNIDCSSSSSSSSSGSESDVDLDFDFPQLTRIINYKKWESESDMLSAFEKDNELYLKAVCALYRMQTTVGRSPKSSPSSNNPGFNQISAHQSSSSYRGFNPLNAHRATTLAEFLVDNDSQGKLKKSVSELLQFDLKGLDDCKKIVFDHSKQLFEIYQKKEDPLFTS